MSDQSFGLGDLSHPGKSFKTTGGDASIVLNVFGGVLRLQVFGSKPGKPIFSQSLSQYTGWMKKAIREISKASPGQEHGFSITAFSREKNQSVVVGHLYFCKTDKNTYQIMVKLPGTEYRADMKGPYKMSYDGTEMSPADKSAMELSDLLNWLETYVSLECVLTARKFERPPQAAPTGTALPADDDIF